ncbi:hypothetical protein F4775DRAFT_595442 [Biscogniauxia sp. FL1348]|nr:hypothetical protein F4775DRAFT_595442 [Biscogniauxia sp. FL1348]
MQRTKKTIKRFEGSLRYSQGCISSAQLRGDLFANADTGEETFEYIHDDPAAKQHVRVDAMDKFRGTLALMLLPLKPSPKDRVRVLNLGSVDMYGDIVKVSSLSFHPFDRQAENPWHCSSGGHGTVMSNMILRITLGIYDVVTPEERLVSSLWVPAHKAAHGRGGDVVVDIGHNHLDEPHSGADIPRTLRFYQETVAAVPGHPLFSRMADCVLHDWSYSYPISKS